MADPLDRALGLGRPEEVHRALVRHSAAVLRRGDVDQLRRAAELIGAGGGPLPAAVAWRVGYGHHQSGRFVEALGYYARADLTGAGMADQAQLYAARASSLWARGEAGASRECADEALRLALACGDDSAVAAAWVAQALVAAQGGDRNANRRAYAKGLAAAERAGEVLTQLRIHTNLGSLEVEEGHYREALGHLDRAMTLWDVDIAPHIRALTCINRADALLGLGRVEEALADAEQAREWTRGSDSPLLGQALLAIGEVNRARGTATQAAAAYREAIGFGRFAGDAQVLVLALSGLARVVALDDPDEAAHLVRQALGQPAALGQVVPLLSAGWVALAAGELDLAAQRARQAVDEAGRRHGAPGQAEALELQALARPDARSHALLGEAAQLWLASGHVIGLATNEILRARLSHDAVAEQVARRRLRALAVRDDALRVAGPLQVIGPGEAPAIAIRTLGSFTVLREGTPVPSSAWQSRRARDALKILAGARGRAVTREELCEHLWPGVPHTGARLSVVLSTVRSVLDPGRTHPPDHYVTADRHSVRLDPATVEIDAVLFHQEARVALGRSRRDPAEAVEHLERAAALYTGPYLEGDVSSDWSIQTRAELLALAQSVRRELAGLLAERGDAEGAVRWLLALIADDPYDEPAYQLLLRCLHAARRHGEVRRYYRAYAARMGQIDTEATDLADLLAR